MSILDNLFKKNTVEKTSFPSQYIEVEKLHSFMTSLLSKNEYISKSEYTNSISKYAEIVDFYNVLSKSGMLKEYCNKNGTDISLINQCLDMYVSFDKTVETHNSEFIKNSLISEKVYLDNILKDVDPEIVLDNNQREVVLSDEDYCLVIAGAGAGKTTTVAAKAKYLIEKKNIDPKEILIVSFTNKAVNELRDKINKNLKLDCTISTFHSIGNAILKTQSDENLNIVDSDKMFFTLQEYFKGTVLNNESMVSKMVLFFSSYLSAPPGEDLELFLNKLSKETNTTLKGDIEEYRQVIKDRQTKKFQTIQNEILRSYQEVQIANFLYLNGIEYEYEPIYKYNIKLANKPYTPDFVIKQGDNVAYIEHFGINENGTNFRYDANTLENYKKAINDKVKLHREHGTKLIYTFSGYNDKKELVEHLKDALITNGFVLNKISDASVLKKISESNNNKYFNKLLVLICRFINNFKTNGYEVEQFKSFSDSTNNVRDKLFLDICKECYLEYERYLKNNNAIDFQDMINNSAKVLSDMKTKEQKLHYKYVIVDEYQDISKQRFDLVGAIHDVCDAKIIAVGDDWQSIYAFSGSDIKLFTDFKNKMGYAKILKIENTYRNSQEVIDIAGNFIQKNETQIKKTLHSPKHIKDPIVIFTYNPARKESGANNKSGVNYNIALSIEKALDSIHQYEIIDKKTCKNILLLGRFNFDKHHLEGSGLFEIDKHKGRIRSAKYPKDDITFMTAHASKGLGYDNVIIINGINGTFGFPSKIENDPVLKFVIKEDNSYDYAEERRLFYVAMTRTKNRVYCIAPEPYPSEFLLEVKREYENVVLNGEWNEIPVRSIGHNKCPICGYPLQYKYSKSSGLRLYICMNEPEVCGFMTNDLHGGKMQIMKCELCQDGYLIVKKKDSDYFLGCTNYTHDGKGCNKSIGRLQYYELMNYTSDSPRTVKMRKKQDFDMNVVPDSNYNSGNLKNSIEKDDELRRVGDTCLDILSCVNTVSQKKYYGVNMIISILRGSAKATNKDVNFGSLPEFKKCNHISYLRLEATINWLIENKYLLKTKSNYPVLHPTDKGGKFKETITPKQLKDLVAYTDFYVKQKSLDKKKNNN